MKAKLHHVIGIDPDVEANGVCHLDVTTKEVRTLALTFPKLLDKLLDMQAMSLRTGEPLVVVVEAGWHIKHNWHVGRGGRAQRNSAIGADMGRNHEVGRKIVEMCKHWGIEVVEQYPLRKVWKGKDRKITHEEIVSFIPIKGKRSCQEVRDAALISWHFANLPIVIRK